jgi:choline dehydrogenase-like flavoprotein
VAKKILCAAGALPVYCFHINTFSHAIGTCRFGDNASTSVLDPECRVWGIKNLFVLDGSFMPSGGSVNPSLTIAANSLRVAKILAAQS